MVLLLCRSFFCCSLKYFPIIQVLVFRFVPQPLWVPLFNLLALAFGVYINVTAKSNAAKK